MIAITILGSTGSIGLSTLSVLAQHPEQYRVMALTANQDAEKLFQQCREWQPRYAVMADERAAEKLRQLLKRDACDIEVLAGNEGLEYVASLAGVDYVMAAIVGAAGLLPTLAAVRAGKRVLLANKEALVMSGQLFMNEVRQHNALLLPIDSEHNAIFQCLPEEFTNDLNAVGVRRILLTASGGPFRDRLFEELHQVTPEQACSHPNWSMGKKISVDSATMLNKGLELIEACHLFNTSADNVQVVIHPQSIIHSLVEYIDGSVLAQLGCADMRIPIAHALAWPQRIKSGAAVLDLFAIAQLSFEKPDVQRFPCLSLAYQAAHKGGSAPAVLNAANEVAVAAFLNGECQFTAIPHIIEQVLARVSDYPASSLEQIFAADRAARIMASEVVGTIEKRVTC